MFEIFEKVARLWYNNRISYCKSEQNQLFHQNVSKCWEKIFFQKHFVSLTFLIFIFLVEIFSGDILIISSFNENEVLVKKNEDKNTKIQKCTFFFTLKHHFRWNERWWGYRQKKSQLKKIKIKKVRFTSKIKKSRSTSATVRLSIL